MSTLSTHVLDLSRGRPARGLRVRLEGRGARGQWKPLGRVRTGADGRIARFRGAALPAGVYRLVFESGAWFAARRQQTFYPQITVEFRLRAGEHYHVPLLLSPFGYSTYRGS